MSRRSTRLLAGGYYHSDEESDSSSVTAISYRENSVKVFQKRKGGGRKRKEGTEDSPAPSSAWNAPPRPALKNPASPPSPSSPPSARPTISRPASPAFHHQPQKDTAFSSAFSTAFSTADSSGYSSAEDHCKRPIRSGTVPCAAPTAELRRRLSDSVSRIRDAVSAAVTGAVGTVRSSVSSRRPPTPVTGNALWSSARMKKLLCALLLLLLLTGVWWASLLSGLTPRTNPPVSARDLSAGIPLKPLEVGVVSAALEAKMLHFQKEQQFRHDHLMTELKQQLQLDIQALNQKSSREQQTQMEAQVQSTLEKLRAQSQKLQGQSEKLQGQSETLQAQSQKLQAQSEKVQAQSQKLQAQSETLQAQSEKVQAQSETLQAQSGQLQAQSESARDSFSLRISALEEQLLQMQQRVDVPPAPQVTPELEQALGAWLNVRLQEQAAAQAGTCGSCGSCGSCERPLADKMADFALESQGASVVSTRCSETYRTRSACVTLFGLPLWYPSESPRTVIQGPAVLLPGKCWAFHGVQGSLVIALSHPVRISHVTLDHLPRHSSPTGRIQSAPKDFQVYGMTNETEEGTLLGTFRYRENGESTQTFSLSGVSEAVYRVVELRVLSNWGHVLYTCVYRFRVHGQMSPAEDF